VHEDPLHPGRDSRQDGALGLEPIDGLGTAFSVYGSESRHIAWNGLVKCAGSERQGESEPKGVSTDDTRDREATAVAAGGDRGKPEAAEFGTAVGVVTYRLNGEGQRPRDGDGGALPDVSDVGLERAGRYLLSG
jgi:hypothetical protein